jgi:hypothetical protein
MDRIEQATAAPGEYRGVPGPLMAWKAAADLLAFCEGDKEKAIAILQALK